MTSTRHVTYLFDPLCGWCYGASPTIQRLAEEPDVIIHPAPTGIFSGAGSRPMDQDFADYAWSNDQRIERLTGQRFSELYRSEVLAVKGRMFDSGPATLALTAVSLTVPEQELEALKAIQEARFLQGRDITSPQELADILAALNLKSASERVAGQDDELLQATRKRVARAQDEMRTVGAQGVPALIVIDGSTRRILRGSILHGSFENLVAELRSPGQV